MKYLSRAQKLIALGIVVLVLALVFLVYSGQFRHREVANPDDVIELQKKENKDLKSLTSLDKDRIESIEIESESTEVAPGASLQFQAKIKGKGGFSQEVTWSLVGDHKEDTQINQEGLLSLSAQEEGPTLHVQAESVSEPGRKATKTILVKKEAKKEPEKASESNQKKVQIEKPKTKAELKQKAAQEQAKVTEVERARRDEEDKQKKLRAIQASSGGKKDKYFTDPVPQGKPKPVEPGDKVDDSKVQTASLSIRCDTILDNMDRFDMDKIDVLPVDGIILPKIQVEFHPGESVYDVLNRVTREQGIHMESSFTPMYNSAYVEGIHNLYEFDCGELSGWMYKVNGWFPNYGCSRYQVKDGDKIEWVYTCDLGRDVGDNSMQ